MYVFGNPFLTVGARHSLRHSVVRQSIISDRMTGWLDEWLLSGRLSSVVIVRIRISRMLRINRISFTDKVSAYGIPSSFECLSFDYSSLKENKGFFLLILLLTTASGTLPDGQGTTFSWCTAFASFRSAGLFVTQRNHI